MKLKYPPCQNCGANDYKIKSLNTYECTYCGSEYEIEIPEESRTVIMKHYGNGIYSAPIMSTLFTGTVAIEKW